MKKICDICGNEFETTSAKRKLCDECRENPRKIRKELKQAEARTYFRTKDVSLFWKNTCPQCGKEFLTPKTDPQKFCSSGCKEAYFVARVKCHYCGKAMQSGDNPPPHTWSTWYCSPECKQAEEWDEADRAGKIAVCPHCGKKFIKKKSSNTYCSKACYEGARKRLDLVKYTCKICGQEIWSKTPRTYCSRACAAKDRHPQSQTMDIRSKRAKQEKVRKARIQEEKLQKYIADNGLCSVCKTPYSNCIRMQSHFSYLPEGAISIDGKRVTSCPQYTPPVSKN